MKRGWMDHWPNLIVRTIVVVGGFLIITFFAACTSRPPIPISIDQVSEVRIMPRPEGSPPPTFRRTLNGGDRSLSEIARYIPRPLPQPIPQTCVLGGDLTIALTDGREIVYGPCKRPIEIERLWWHVIDVLSNHECRPDCWPGSQHPPGESIPPDVSSD